MKVKVKLLHKDAKIPEYKTKGAAGFDIEAIEDVYVPAGGTALVKTGLAFEVPEGYELQIRPRSGNSLKTKLRISNSPGTIDFDFRGQVCVIIDNIASKDDLNSGLHIKKGDRIAQGVICPVVQVLLEKSEELSDTERGNGGFGSTN